MKRREPLTLDLTPLIDVVFILIIFFIVTSSFKSKDYALNLTLPSAVAQETKIKKDQISIEVGIKNIAYMKQKITLLDLSAALEIIKDKTASVIVKIDKDVPYSKVISILDILQLHDLNNLALLTSDK